MTAQEKQETLFRLRTVIPLFQEFEQAYNMVATLPQQKKGTYGELDVPEPLKGAATTGTSILVTVISYVVLIIPSIMVAGGLAGILRLTSHTGLILLASIVINVIGAKYLGGFITKKIRAGGNKIQDTVNQQIRKSNQAADIHNTEVDRQIALAEQKCNAVRQQILQLDLSWYPPDYYCSDAANFFYKAVNNGMCESLGEAVRLYEETLFKNQVLVNQQKQIDLAYRQCILQGLTIAAIQAEGEATRGVIQAEGNATRGVIQAEGAAGRAAIHAEGTAAREQRERQYKDFLHRFGK